MCKLFFSNKNIRFIELMMLNYNALNNLNVCEKMINMK